MFELWRLSCYRQRPEDSLSSYQKLSKINDSSLMKNAKGMMKGIIRNIEWKVVAGRKMCGEY